MKRVALIICVAALAACNKSPEIHEKNASIEQVANAARDAGLKSDLIFHAGQWQLKTTIEEMTIAGLPASAQARMKGVMGPERSHTVDYCMSAEDAKRPGGKVFTGEASHDCRFERYDVSGGKIDAVMRCERPSGTATTTISGTFSADSFTNVVTTEAEGPRGTTTMKMRMEAHRVGDCTGETKVTVQGG